MSEPTTTNEQPDSRPDARSDARPAHPLATGVASRVSAEQRAALLGQRGAVIWLTGLSGAGKSTLGYALEHHLITRGRMAYTLDGDVVRCGLSSDLGFSADDRAENIRRVGEVAALFADAGALVVSAFISPQRAARAAARAAVGSDRFIEVYLDVPLAVCERRDPKGLYKRARAGEIPRFTGVSAPYEVPENPELRLDTDALDVAACVERIVQALERRGLLAACSA